MSAEQQLLLMMPQQGRRPGALGRLQVLPDELLCGILELLSPQDIGRLACVSSVLYILSTEEPLWLGLCVREGGSLEYKGSWKTTYLYKHNLFKDVDGNPGQKTLQFDGFDSLFLYRRWYRRFTTLNAFTFDNGGIERKKNLSLEEFRSDYDCQKPVLLTELANGWPARSTWSLDLLLRNYGDVAFRISQRSAKKINMKFKDYVAYMELQHDEDPLYVFDDEFGEAAPTLLKDYDVPHLFQEDFFDVLDRDQRPPFRWLIIGPERSGASWHVDPGLTSAWNTLISGRKRWALYPPGRVPAGVTVHVNEDDGDVNIDTPSSLQWWLDVYPLLSDEDKPVECTQLPGETIYVPSGWWHCVLNLETTVAVTQNFVNTPNFEFVCLDLAPGHLHKGVCRAGLLAAQDKNYAVLEDQVVDSVSFEKEVCSRRDNENIPMKEEVFSYDISFLSKYLEKDKDHYSSVWCASNYIGQREMRSWLHKLWIMKPQIRELIWKGACLALNVQKWSECLLAICSSHGLSLPSEEEKFPVGTGSNPVYLISDFAIKIYVEDGLDASLHSLGSEIELHDTLIKTNSPVREHVPSVFASGILFYDNGVYTTMPWVGEGYPRLTSKTNVTSENYTQDKLSFGVWSKKQLECMEINASTATMMWPYLITQKCKGDILANVRHNFSKEDALDLASFLGYQLRNLHILPVPLLHDGYLSKIIKADLRTCMESLTSMDAMSTKYSVNGPATSIITIPLECQLFIAAIDHMRKNLRDRLVQWGSPIPSHLIEKVEDYVPTNIAFMLTLCKDENNAYNFFGSLNWLHSDIMDDNILVEASSPSSLNGFTQDITGHELIGCANKACEKQCTQACILDFSNLSIGDPMNDLIPIYLDVFRGDSALLMHLLASYGLPLTSEVPCNVEVDTKYKKLSYRAMCYCILHSDNVLGAIFSLWRDLRSVNTWEEVEEAVWGFLNEYCPKEDRL